MIFTVSIHKGGFHGKVNLEEIKKMAGLAIEALEDKKAEDIRVTVWAYEDALQAVRDGRISNAASIIALQWLALNRAEVRGLWS